MFVYIVKFNNITPIKIGSTKDFNKRSRTLLSDFGSIDSYSLYKVSDYYSYEKKIHKYFNSKRSPQQSGRGKTEFFNITLETCEAYFAGSGIQPIPNYTAEDLSCILYTISRLDSYRATIKLRRYLKDILKTYPTVISYLERDTVFFSYRESTQEVLLEFI